MLRKLQLEKLRYLKAASQPNLSGTVVEASNTYYNSYMYLILTCTVDYWAQGKRAAEGMRQSHMHSADFS